MKTKKQAIEIIKKLMGVMILCITVPMGLVAMCYGRIISSLISLVWNTYYTKKIIGYGYAQQMKDLMHILLHSLVMGAITYGVVGIFPNLWLKLIVGISAGAVYYIAGAYLMKFEEFDELLKILKLKKTIV